jgi:hypothetical protein
VQFQRIHDRWNDFGDKPQSHKGKEKAKYTDEDVPRLQDTWFKQYEDIFQEQPEKLPPKREVVHRIPLKDPKKEYKYYSPRCPEYLRAQLREKMAKYICAGWWVDASVHQAVPMLCIPKKDNSLRTALDCRQRNANTYQDVTPFPDQDNIRNDVAKAKYRSKIDMTNAYEQILVHEEDIPHTAFATIYGTFHSRVMQIGDCNAPSTFQRLMTSIFREHIGQFVHVYLDDIFVYSDSIEEHEEHLKKIFDLLRKHEFHLRDTKVQLYANKMDCLGHIIDNEGIHAAESKMERIRDWRTPRNYNDVQKFLGLIQYIAPFLPDISQYTTPLSSMTSNGQSFSWRAIHEHCFQQIKNVCASTPVLRPVDLNSPEDIWVICDASVSGCGAMYGQGKSWQDCRPAGFMSKKFSNAQRNYGVSELEALAILEALLKWEDKLRGRRINIVTDHRALEFFHSKKHLSPRQTRWMDFLSRFDTDIKYVKGSLNKVADALSRYYANDTWYDTHPQSDYVNADVRLDREGDDLTQDRRKEVQEDVVKLHALRVANTLERRRSQRILNKQEQRDLEAAKLNAGMPPIDEFAFVPAVSTSNPTVHMVKICRRLYSTHTQS